MIDSLEHIVLKGITEQRPCVVVLFSDRSTGRTFRDRLVGFLVRWVGMTQLAHVAIQCGDEVWNPLTCGDSIYDARQYSRMYPGLRSAVYVPIEGRPNMGLLMRPRRRIWPSVVRRLTGGRNRSDDCVYATIWFLRDQGVLVPKHLVTPDQLMKWFVSQGFMYAFRTKVAP